jgi:hypothetical protein
MTADPGSRDRLSPRPAPRPLCRGVGLSNLNNTSGLIQLFHQSTIRCTRRRWDLPTTGICKTN